MAYFGYVPNKSSMDALKKLSNDQLIEYWSKLEPVFKSITLDDRNMGDSVVYKNFPQEVLDMTQSQYWISQIFMYIGCPNDWFTQDADVRHDMSEKFSLQVLELATEQTIREIYSEIVLSTKRWTDDQLDFATFLFSYLKMESLNFDEVMFNENAAMLSKVAISLSKPILVADATNVLRIASLLVTGETRVRSNTRFKTMSHSLRKSFLLMLENSKNLEDDIALNSKAWKNLFMYLRVGSYKNRFPRCIKVYDLLYNNNQNKTVSGQLDKLLSAITPVNKSRSPERRVKNKEPERKLKQKQEPYEYEPEKLMNGIGNVISKDVKGALYEMINSPVVTANMELEIQDRIKKNDRIKKENSKCIKKEILPSVCETYVEVKTLLISRPNEVIKRFHHLYSLFGDKVLELLEFAVKKQSIQQLLELRKYIETINLRENQLIAPAGKWSHLKVFKNEKTNIDPNVIKISFKIIDKRVKELLMGKFSNGVNLCNKTKDIKLPSNDQELAKYGQGTIFDIPEKTKFIRSASFWSFEDASNIGNIWYDNCWSFFDENWKSKGHCDWTKEHHSDGDNNKSAVFSGDPTNSKDVEGRACQMIDLYVDKLEKEGIRYAVWSILCYSNQPFSEAKEVLGTLQFGENAQEGKLYEPSRVKMAFPIKGNNLTKFIAYIDTKSRKLIFMDANLPASINAPSDNLEKLEGIMPAYCEYMDAKPSIYDLFQSLPNGNMNILFSDEGISLEDDSDAYVFERKNNDNTFKDINIGSLLCLK
jgi:hypothetical protein